MKIMRLALATASALVAVGLAVGGAAAGSMTEVAVTRGIVFDSPAAASQTCGFPIELHTVGKIVEIRHYDAEGALRSETIQVHWDGYLLNPANGKTIATRVSGPERYVYLDDGSIWGTSAGATTRTAPGSGLVSGFIGLSSVLLVPTGETDEDGFPIYDFVGETFHGQFLGNQGVCDVLA